MTKTHCEGGPSRLVKENSLLGRRSVSDCMVFVTGQIHLIDNHPLETCLNSPSHQQGSALKGAAGGTPVATAATAPCPRRPETRPHPGPREALFVATPASRSPMCEVASARRTHRPLCVYLERTAHFQRNTLLFYKVPLYCGVL